ncbi:hypothetical protein B4950_00005 [Vibrio cholerae]|nr:hypothetical protein [Vibrio cholerae]MCD1212930.1 hypothetical protein [Vibrio cholerae]MCD1242480.1 hypothetical protein [Vibrio cholerae]MCD1247870.1 hypothetical protein [Vibrio cholerae]
MRLGLLESVTQLNSHALCQWCGFLYLDRELRYHRKSQCYDNAKPKRILQEIESLNLEMSQM